MNLKTFVFSENHFVTKNKIENIDVPFPHFVQYVDVSGCGLTNEQFATLAKNTHFRTLIADNNGISIIPKLTGKMEHISLVRNKITTIHD